MRLSSSMAQKVEVRASHDDLGEDFGLKRVNLDTFEAEMSLPHWKKVLYRFHVGDSIVVDPALLQWTNENDKVYNLLELQPPNNFSADNNETTP